MAITKCPQCGKGVSDQALNCPACGCAVKEELEKEAKRKAEKEHKELERIERERQEATRKAEEEKKRLEEELRRHNEIYMNCPECSAEVKRTVDICPECGFPIAETNKANKALKAKRKKQLLVACLICVIAIVGIVMISSSNRSKSYKKAIANIQMGNYYDAEEALEKLGDYKEAEKYLEIADLGSSLNALSEVDFVEERDAKDMDYYADVFELSEPYSELSEVRESALLVLKAEVEELAEHTYDYDDMNKAVTICGMIENYVDVSDLSDLCWDAFFDLYYGRDGSSLSSTSSSSTEDDEIEPYIGMSEYDAEYNCTWGSPSDKNITETEYGRSEQWVYRGYGYLYIEDGKVTAIQK